MRRKSTIRTSSRCLEATTPVSVMLRKTRMAATPSACRSCLHRAILVSDRTATLRRRRICWRHSLPRHTPRLRLPTPLSLFTLLLLGLPAAPNLVVRERCGRLLSGLLSGLLVAFSSACKLSRRMSP